MDRRFRALPILLLATGLLGARSAALAAGGGHGGGGHGGGGGHVGVAHGGGWYHGDGPGFRGYYGNPYGYGYYGFGLGYGGYYGYPYGYGYATNYPYYGYPSGYAPGGAYYADPSYYPPPGPGIPPPGIPGAPEPAPTTPEYPVNRDPAPAGPAPSTTAASTLVGSVTPPPARSPETEIALIVRTPADAVVWVNGLKMTQTGPRREFVSYGPDPRRTYTFLVRARWSEPDGRAVDVIRRVPVQAGERRVVDFTPLPAAPVQPPSAPVVPSP